GKRVNDSQIKFWIDYWVGSAPLRSTKNDTRLFQSGYHTIEAALADRKPVVIQQVEEFQESNVIEAAIADNQAAVLQIDEFKEINAIEKALTNIQAGRYFKKLKKLLTPAINKDGHESTTEAVEIGVVKTTVIETIAVPALQLDELNEVTGNFGIDSLIGEGLFGKVYFGVLRSGQAAAIKKLDSSGQSDQEFLAQVSRISTLEHENVLRMLGYSIDGGTLHKDLLGIFFMARRKGVKGAQPGPALSWAQRVKIAVGAAKGLEYLHETAQPPIVHRDIKSSNILLFDDYVAKIADIDLSNYAPDMSERGDSTRAFNFGYHAPEYALTGQLTSESDVYTFGIVLLELLTGRKPVDHTLPRGQQSLVTWATAKLYKSNKYKLKTVTCDDLERDFADPRLYKEYPLKAFIKIAMVAELCIQYEADLRPNMRIVVKALQPLLNAIPSPHPVPPPPPPPSPPRTPSPTEVPQMNSFICCCWRRQSYSRNRIRIRIHKQRE
ncbi:hypothetical protein M8C21_024016, partial [Ambrosia artemisiifolia]